MIKSVLPILSFLLSFSFFLIPNLNGQNYEGVPISSFDEAPYLKEQFKKFEVFALDIDGISDYVARSGESYDLNIQIKNSFSWNMSLSENEVKGPDFKVLVGNRDGVVEESFNKPITFSGYLKDGGSTRMTINDGFLYGLIEKDGKTYFIEPLKHFNNQSPNSFFVVYEFNDVIKIEGKTCGATDFIDKKNEIDPHVHDHDHDHGLEGKSMACYDVDIRLAADWSMNTKYGGVTGTVNFMMGVLNNVATNYDNEFNDDLILISNSNFVSNCSTCDPWTASTTAGTLLSSFRTWGQNNGFGTTDFEAATLWTDRNLAGSTIGIAYVGAVCTAFKYNVCEDFTSNSANLRVLQAHELGHNFNASHDAGGSPFIMAPSVNTSVTWSTTSQNSINSYVSSAANGGCFNPCGSGPGPGGSAPVANFSSPHSNPICPGTSVNYTDLSTNTPTSWSWSFPGGTPSSSTAQNPTVVYNTAGTFNAVLTATNASGNDTETKINFVVVGGTPVAAFSSTSSANIATFTDNSTGIPSSWFWQFGDGNTSTDQNPTHAYAAGGSYVATLTATNSCGTNTVSNVVTVGSPVTTLSANFTSNHSNPVCAGEFVQFTDLSTGNPFGYSWSFPGGTPSFSSAANPLIRYNTPGTYDVSLTVLSPLGFANEVKQGYVVVTSTGATAAYSFTSNNNFFTFTDQSTNANTWLWDFGDGSTSSLQNPTHTYANAGTYQVKLTASNGCGGDTETKTVVSTGGTTPTPTANFTSNHSNPTCAGSISFTNTSTGSPTSYSWSFPGGSPSSSTATNPTVNYTTPGSYNVILTATNASGSDTETKINFVVISNTPTANFTSSTNNLTATFSNASTNASSYSWNFGDGNTSTATNPTHTYSSAGTYTVTLTASNSCGNNTTTNSVTVTAAAPSPVANFTSNHSNPICSGTVVNFTDTSTGNPTSWSWSFPGGTPSTSTLQNPTVTYNTAGTRNVTLTATNANGSDTETKFNYVVVSAAPTASFSSTTNNLTVTFTNTSSSATSYSWNFGDGNTSTAFNPVHTYAAPGTYNVTLTATGTCGTDNTTNSVTVTNPPAGPTANFTSNRSNPMCGGTVVNFSDISTGNPTSWSWSFPGGSPSSSTLQNPSVTYFSPGNRNVTLTVTNAGGSDSETKFNYIVVASGPTANFTSSSSFNTVAFTNSSINATTYTWNFGDGNNSTATSPTHSYSAAGTYNVTLVATNACGSNTTSRPVTVTMPGVAPTASFTSGHTNPLCSGSSVSFTSTSSGNPTSHSWSFPGGSPAISSAMNPTVTYNTPGTYNVTLTVTNSSGTDTKTEIGYVVVTASGPTAMFSSSGAGGTALAFQNLSTGGATSYTWSFGDGNTSTATNPVHNYPFYGIFFVELTATNACGSNTFASYVFVTGSLLTGIDDLENFESINVFPNPSNGQFTVEATGVSAKQMRFTVLNNLGQVVYRDTDDFTSGYLRKDFQLDLAKGLYLIQMEVEGETLLKKLQIH